MLWNPAAETSATVAAALTALATRCARAAPRFETRWTRVRFSARVLFLVMRHLLSSRFYRVLCDKKVQHTAHTCADMQRPCTPTESGLEGQLKVSYAFAPSSGSVTGGTEGKAGIYTIGGCSRLHIQSHRDRTAVCKATRTTLKLSVQSVHRSSSTRR